MSSELANTSPQVTFAAAIVLLAYSKIDDYRPEVDVSDMPTAWSRCLSILEYYDDQIPSASHAIRILNSMKNQVLGAPRGHSTSHKMLIVVKNTDSHSHDERTRTATGILSDPSIRRECEHGSHTIEPESRRRRLFWSREFGGGVVWAAVDQFGLA